MNQEAREELDRILAIEPVALSEAEVGFLRARRSYLTEEQKAAYAEVLASAEKLAKAEKSEKAEKLAKEDK